MPVNDTAGGEGTPSSLPLVSVVVPAFNAQRHLPDTLRSILGQRAVDLEVLVIDDCSTDSTAACVTEIASADPRVRYIRTASNYGGPAGPRNEGFAAARAQWVALCDADDLWHPDKLRVQCSVAERTGSSLVCTAIEDFPDGSTPEWLGKPARLSMSVQVISYVAMLLKNRIATSSVLVRRDDVVRVGGFDTAKSLVAVEDYDLWLRMLEQPSCKAVRIASPLVAYRRIPGSLSASKWRQARKAIAIPRRAAQRNGWAWAYPLAMPVLVGSYAAMSLYSRVLRGRL
jgi:glycosyltransferase involved in cell wall biosynthesis